MKQAVIYSFKSTSSVVFVPLKFVVDSDRIAKLQNLTFVARKLFIDFFFGVYAHKPVLRAFGRLIKNRFSF